MSLNKIDFPRQICFKIIKLKVNKLTLRFKKIFYSIKITLLGKFVKGKKIKLKVDKLTCYTSKNFLALNKIGPLRQIYKGKKFFVIK